MNKIFLYFSAIMVAYSSVALADSNPPIEDSNNIGIAVYGNWCGRNHPINIETADAPIDILDQQCKTHDLCYIKKGDFDCGCDRSMVLEIDDSQKQKQYTSEQYLLAQNIKIHFSLSPCEGEVDGNKMLPTRILTKIYKGTKKRVINTYNRLMDRFY